MAGTTDPTAAAPEPAPSLEPADSTPPRPRRWAVALGRLLLLLAAAGVLFELSGSSSAGEQPQAASGNQPVQAQATQLVDQGRQIFRFDTFGDEQFWGDSLKLHRAVAGAANGGVGPGLSPRAALGIGLKVDVDALPPELQQALARGEVNLDDPAVTLALLRLNAVVGVTGFFDADGGLRGTDVATVKRVLAAWGPGKFDAELFLDGKGFRPDGKTAATLIPPAYGLAGVNLHTYTGWGSVPYWNAFVANLEMHGQGVFYDPRLDNAKQFPVAARNRSGHVTNSPDLITPKLAALHFYQLALAAPKPPDGSIDPAAAARGARLFRGKAECATCHVPPLFTEPGWNLHTPAEIGIDRFQADRSPTHRYRTTPLKGLWAHQKGGFYHDGRFATLGAVVDHYDRFFELGLTPREKRDLAQYLKS